MSSEIQISYPAGYTLYACVRDSTGKVWYAVGQVFETWGTAGRTAADYAISLPGTTNLYVGDMDANIAAGLYVVQGYLQAGGTPADADGAPIGDGLLSWSGTAENQPAFAGDEMALLDDAITAAKFDETTAYPLASPDSGATEVARTGADGDTLETLSDQLDSVGAWAIFHGRETAEVLPLTIERTDVMGTSA